MILYAKTKALLDKAVSNEVCWIIPTTAKELSGLIRAPIRHSQYSATSQQPHEFSAVMRLICDVDRHHAWACHSSYMYGVTEATTAMTQSLR